MRGRALWGRISPALVLACISEEYHGNEPVKMLIARMFTGDGRFRSWLSWFARMPPYENAVQGC